MHITSACVACVFLHFCAHAEAVHLRHRQNPEDSEKYVAAEPRKDSEFYAFHNMVPGTAAINHFWDNSLQAHTFHAGGAQGVEIELSTEFFAFDHPVPGTAPIYEVSSDGTKRQVQFYAFTALDAAQKYAASQGLTNNTMYLDSNRTEVSPLTATTDAEIQQAWDGTVEHERGDLQPPLLQNMSDADWYSEYFAHRQNNSLEELSYTANQTQPTAEQAQALQQREDDAWAALEPNVTAEEEEAYAYYHENFTHDDGNALENFTDSDDYYAVDDAVVQLGRSAAQAEQEANATGNASEANVTDDAAL